MSQPPLQQKKRKKKNNTPLIYGDGGTRQLGKICEERCENPVFTISGTREEFKQTSRVSRVSTQNVFDRETCNVAINSPLLDPVLAVHACFHTSRINLIFRRFVRREIQEKKINK